MALAQTGPGVAVLPGRPPRAIRKGRCGSRRRDPRPRGRRRGQGPAGRATGASRHPARSGPHGGPGQPRDHAGPRARRRGTQGHRLHHGDAGQDRDRRAGARRWRRSMWSCSSRLRSGHWPSPRRRGSTTRSPSCGAPRTSSPPPAARRTAGPTAATATSPSTCGRRVFWPPKPLGGWRSTRCTSTSRTSTGCAPRPTTPLRSGSTPRSPFIPRRWRSSAPGMRPPTIRSNGRARSRQGG